ncbi:MAG: bifunctional oligoribonuclease/PAP phosphatase NrnA [Clostridia bacterium]|nr:bifunctional oligoribonuclease/PAP phosphatase NrnA [Clostridia bacterium]
MSAFRSLTLDEVCEQLCQPKCTLIVYHIRSDADAVGSAFALRELLQSMKIPALCACSDEVPERLRFLSEPAQGSVLLDDELRIGHERVISVDSASPAQLGELFHTLHRDIDLMIDHHANGTVYADSYIDPMAAATGEIIYRIAKRLWELGRLSGISHRFSSCVYAAISSDTGCFRYANVTPATLRCAAELLEAGVEAAEINHRLFDSKTEQQILAEGEAARRLRLYAGGRVAGICFPHAVKQAMALSDEHLETVIDIPRSVAGVEVAFAIRQPTEQRSFRASLRSNGECDVAAVCAKFGGGGHKRAAGCTIEAVGIEAAEAALLREIMENFFDYRSSGEKN